jgi:hypothetical protein
VNKEGWAVVDNGKEAVSNSVEELIDVKTRIQTIRDTPGVQKSDGTGYSRRYF